MQLPKQKIGIVCLWVMLLLISSTFLNLLIHEGSHLLTLLICNGTFESLSLGTTSFVGGYVEPEYISIISISSLIIPTIISIVLFFIKNFYGSVFFLGFTLPNITNASFGLFAAWFISDVNTRVTYDIALAYDYANIPWLIVLITILANLINIILLVLKTKNIITAT